MDVGIVAAIALLLVWGVITFIVNDAPGFTHALLIAGVSLLVIRIAQRSAPPGSERPRQP